MPSSSQKIYSLELLRPLGGWQGSQGSGGGALPCREERGPSCFPATVPVSTARASLWSMQGEAAVCGAVLSLAWCDGGGRQLASQCQQGGRPCMSHSRVGGLGAARPARGMERLELRKVLPPAGQRAPGQFGTPVLSP